MGIPKPLCVKREKKKRNKENLEETYLFYLNYCYLQTTPIQSSRILPAVVTIRRLPSKVKIEKNQKCIYTNNCRSPVGKLSELSADRELSARAPDDIKTLVTTNLHFYNLLVQLQVKKLSQCTLALNDNHFSLLSVYVCSVRTSAIFFENYLKNNETWHESSLRNYPLFLKEFSGKWELCEPF